MGEGIIRVNKGAFGEGVAMPVTLQDWHKRLLLPSDYWVVDLAADDYVYKVSVVSNTIRNDVSDLPDVTPIYTKSGDAVSLDRIEIRYLEEEA
jgi:hypothetical protein